MPTTSVPSRHPSDTGTRALLAQVARRYYLQDESKVAIAADLGLSRFKVARMLATAREQGIVRIEIVDDTGIDIRLSLQLKDRLGLRSATVLVGNATDAPHRFASVAAVELHRALQDGDVLGLPWSRMVSRVIAASPDLPKVTVVQLSGALTLTEIDSPVDVVREAARLSGGPAHHFYAPLVATDSDSAQMLRRQPTVAGALAHATDVTTAVVGVGAWQPGQSTVFDLATPAERSALGEAGVVGEVAGAFVDADGNSITTGMTRRLITVTGDQLRAIPHVIAVVAGSARAEAVHAAIRAGLVDSLVVDTELALALVSSEEGDRAR